MADAMKQTKLTDFGDMPIYLRFWDWLSETPTFKNLIYSNLGRIVASKELAMNFVRRLKLEAYFKANPNIKKIPIKEPIFVMGFGRSGTTFIHRLLSLDPQVRSPKLWELVSPCPDISISETGTTMDKDLANRKELVRKRIKEREWLGNDSLEHIHEIGHDLPEECLFAMSNVLPLNFQLLYVCFMEGKEFVFGKQNKQDIDVAYKNYKGILQLLSFQQGDTVHPKRWVLKCPLHVFWISSLHSVFPDCKVIWAHRHPVSNFSSICGLVQAIHPLYYEKSCKNDKNLGERMYELMKSVIMEGPDEIQRLKIPCAHIVFEDLVANPIEVVKSIYTQMGWTFTKQYQQLLEAYIEENNKKRAKTQKKATKSSSGDWHSLKEFGVTSDR